MKVAVLGVGGMGKVHVREFNNLGGDVVAILDVKEKVEEKIRILYEEFGVKVRAYYDLNKLLENEEIDAVSICTPYELHEQQVRTCLEKGLNALCEKPLVANTEYENYQIVKELVDLSKKKNKILTVNTQWPSVFSYINDYVDLKKIESFSMYMEPGVKEVKMLIEHLPHTNSMLVRLIPDGNAENIRIDKKEDEIIIEFDYKNENQKCRVKYDFQFKADRPRKVGFSINGKKFLRKIRENYQQSFIFDDKVIDIEDPLKISIRKFIEAVMEKGKPLISVEEILENVRLQDEIIKAYLNN